MAMASSPSCSLRVAEIVKIRRGSERLGFRGGTRWAPECRMAWGVEVGEPQGAW